MSDKLFPAAYGQPVTQAHADKCQQDGHAKWTRDAVDTAACPRCGEVKYTLPTYTISNSIKGEDLQEYARLLISNGFTVRIWPRQDAHGEPIPQSWFVYERNGHGGHVEAGFDGYNHYMPIKPSRVHGSSIITNRLVAWDLRLEDAEKTVQAKNVALFGKGTAGITFKNDYSNDHYSDSYVAVTR